MAKHFSSSGVFQVSESLVSSVQLKSESGKHSVGVCGGSYEGHRQKNKKARNQVSGTGRAEQSSEIGAYSCLFTRKFSSAAQVLWLRQQSWNA
jgi:hypothetical protein